MKTTIKRSLTKDDGRLYSSEYKRRKGAYFHKLPLSLQVALKPYMGFKTLWVPAPVFQKLAKVTDSEDIKKLLLEEYADLAYGKLGVLAELGD